MSDRVDFYFRQRVTEAEMDLAFDQLEQADRDLAADLNIRGIVCGAVPSEHAPVADLSLDLTGPARAYDRLGRRIFFGTDQRVSLATDLNGRETKVNAEGNEKWLSVSLAFDRKLSDPRTDGSSNKVFFRRDESFRTVVRQAPEMPEGTRLMAEVHEDEVLVCDVRLIHGQSQVKKHDIELSRRQSFIFADAGAVSVEPGLWKAVVPDHPTVQSALEAADRWMADRETALASTDDASPGSGLVGSAAVQGSAFSLPEGTVQKQLTSIAGCLDGHLSPAGTGLHPASSIAAQPHGILASTDVQAQLQEILTVLSSQSQVKGGALVGEAELKGSPHSIIAGTVRSQLAKLLSLLNTHVTGGDHDGRYLRVLFSSTESFAAGEERAVATLVTAPALVTVSYTQPAIPLATSKETSADAASDAASDAVEVSGNAGGDKSSNVDAVLPLSDMPSATTILEHSLSGTGSLDTLIQKRLDEMARVLQGPMSDKLEWRTEAVADRKAIEKFIQSNVLAHGGKKDSAAKPHPEAVAAHPEIALPEVVTQLLEFIAATARTRLYVKNGNKKKLTLHVTAWG